MPIRRPTAAAAAFLSVVFSLVGTFPGPAIAAPVQDHPRLWVRSSDLPVLTARLHSAGPVQQAFTSLAQQALADWQSGKVPQLDNGSFTGNGNAYPSELWGMVFAFLSMIEDDPAKKATWTSAAHDCLMFVMDQASLGPGTPDAGGNYPPFRHPDFTLADRGFHSEAFALMVDWLQATPGALSAADMGKIRKTFLWWADAAENAYYFSPYNPDHLVNDPALLRLAPPASAYEIDNRVAVREALNNHYANRLKTHVMTALALDPADDVPAAPGDTAPPGALTGYVQGAAPSDWVYTGTGYLRSGTGAWMYLTDYGLRHDGGGGGSQEGLEYMSNGLAPVAFALLALQTAGQDDIAQWGPQVSMTNHPFWDKAVGAFLDVLPPEKRIVKDYEYRGGGYEPAWFGDGEQYGTNDQFIKILAPLALHDVYASGDINAPRMKAVRFYQSEMAQGGVAKIADRIQGCYSERRLRDAIFYFLLFDPSGTSEDPRPSQPETSFQSFDPAGTMGAIHARAGQGSSRSFFDWRLGWNRVDHQHGDGGSFELWRNGVWLTKRWIGYGAIAGNSDFNNALAVQNDPLPASDTFLPHQTNNRHGSQYGYSADDDPVIRAKSLAKNFLHVDGESTGLYNIYDSAAVHDVTHVSRSIVWLKPDHVVVYDRAETNDAGRFKRFWLALPQIPAITGNVAKITAVDDHGVGGVPTSTPKADFWSTTVLPAGATLAADRWHQMIGSCALPGGATVDCDGPDASACVAIDAQTGRCPSGHATCQCQDEGSAADPAFVRLRVEAPGGPASARFLHVLQAGDPGAAYTPATALQSSAGTAYDGVMVAGNAVLFRKNLAETFAGVTYDVPAPVTGQLVTGLLPATTYYVTQASSGGAITVSIATSGPGVPAVSDSGGVLALGGIEPADVSIEATDAAATEAGSDPATFTVHRSGSIGSPLSVHYSLTGSAGNGTDYATLSGVVTIPAGAASASLDVSPVDDAVFEGVETVVATIDPDPAYYAADGAAAASAEIADDDPPPGGFLQFASATGSVAENAGSATLMVTRSGAASGSASVLCSTSGGTATASGDYTVTSSTLTWGPGDSSAKPCTIPLIDDATYEGDETIGVTLGNVGGQAALGLPHAALLTLVDNEPAPPGQFLLNAAAYTVAENGGSVTVKVKRSGGNGGPASVSYATSDGSASAGSDYTAKSGVLNWNAGESMDQAIVIPILGDDAFEGGSETFGFTLSGSSIPLGSPASATVTITDDDPQPVEFDVGPGWSFASIGDVPWSSLVAGSVVRIHGKTTPYFEKFLVSSRGTQADPIRVTGVPGPSGEVPVIDGSGATTSPGLHFVSDLFTESHGIVAIARDADDAPSFKPGWIELSGLEIRGGNGSFTTAAGIVQSYSSLSGAVLVQGAEHVTIRDCVIHDVANGIVVESQGSEASVSRDVTIAGNHLYTAGWPGFYNGRNVQLQAAGVLIERNRLDAPANGSNGYNVEDRSAGLVLRYNRIEGGGNLLLLADSGSAPIRAETGYAKAFVYGNLLLDGPNDPGTLVVYGGSSGNTANYRKGTLHFFHNTALLASNAYEPSVFGLSTAEENLDARNNLLWRSPVGVSFGSAPLKLATGSGVASFAGSWISAGYAAGSASVTVDASVVTGAAPGLADEAAGDYTPAVASPARNIGVALAAEAATLPVTKQYLDVAQAQLRPLDGSPDAGAFEYGTIPVECGNAVVEAGEDCDPGAPVTGDCCSDACALVGVGSVCRAASAPCDVAETCTGSSAACPADAVATADLPCRAAAGPCDVAESCDGTSKACPANALAATVVVCRSSAGACDLAENCDGANASCPADVKRSGTCRAAAGACDIVENCDGISSDCPSDARSSAECRGTNGPCDAPEWCDGVATSCPPDLAAPDGTPCNDGSGCPLADQCVAGQCLDEPCVKPDHCDSGLVVEKARLKLKASPMQVRASGELLLPRPWIAVDPAVTGLRVVVPGVLDADLPGGARWKWNAGAARWTYRDADGAVAGITQASVRDLSTVEDGRLRVQVKGKGAAIALPSADAMAMEWMFGDYAECGVATWGGPSEARPNCRGQATQLQCR